MRYTLSDREFTFFSQMVYRINSLTCYEEVAATVLKQLQYIIPFTKGIIFQICETEPGMGLVYQNPVALDPPGQAFDEDRFMKGSYRSDWLSYTSSPWSNTFRQSDIRDEATFRDTPSTGTSTAPRTSITACTPSWCTRTTSWPSWACSAPRRPRTSPSGTCSSSAPCPSTWS